jgi:hypothetical protein
VFRLRLHRTPADDRNLAKTRTTLLAPALLVVYICTMPVLLINYYVIPYQSGAGLLLADGSLNWASGEVVLASAVLYIPLGLISSRVIWRRYRPLEPGAGANNIL